MARMKERKGEEKKREEEEPALRTLNFESVHPHLDSKY